MNVERDDRLARERRNLPPSGNKREGSGEWVKLVERVEEHQCRLPGTFAKEPGSQWRCDCGEVWVVTQRRVWVWGLVKRFEKILEPLDPGIPVVVVPSE